MILFFWLDVSINREPSDVFSDRWLSKNLLQKSLENESGNVKKDIADLELAIQRAEQERKAKDHTIKGLNEDVLLQDELINKLNKEKKHLKENSAKSSEDLQAVNDKVDHLGNVKAKLEATRDELEATVEKEKRARTVVEKQRRQVEGELKMAQATVAEIERSKKELEASILRKEAEVQAMASKLDDEQSLVGKVQKAIKDNQGRVEELEEELEAERQARWVFLSLCVFVCLFVFIFVFFARPCLFLSLYFSLFSAAERRRRDRGRTWHERWKVSERDFLRPAEPPLLKWNSTRRERRWDHYS